jgi:replicative DNA helicase
LRERSEDGLPANLAAEKFVLGSILLDATHYPVVAGTLEGADFSLEKHRRIFKRMGEVHARGDGLDRITLADELLKAGELESVDGLGYLVSLDDGLPQIPNVEAYVRMVRDSAILRSIVYASHGLATRASLHDAEPSALLSEAGASFLALAERSSETTLQSPSQIIEAGGGLSVYLDRRNRSTGTQSGYRSMDVMTGGFKPGGLYILAARPAMGKTAFALNIAERVAVDGESIVPIFSLEMDKESLVDRLICSRARVNTKRFDGGFMDTEERSRVWKAAGDIAADERVLIDDRANTNTQEIHSKIRKQQARGPVGLVIIDYLQLLIDGDDAHRVAAASRISRELKLIAKDCKVPVLALSQLSRVCETRTDKRPILSDLRETGAIEQDADVVAMLYREEVYTPDREDLRGLAELIIRKQRGGPIGTVPLVWLSEIVRFEEMARE